MGPFQILLTLLISFMIFVKIQMILNKQFAIPVFFLEFPVRKVQGTESLANNNVNLYYWGFTFIAELF